MSATPIPRTYALTIYGDTDVSSIKTMPKGRIPIITKLKTRYREIYEKFNESKNEFGEIGQYVELQFENISKRFEDFEDVMDRHEYTETTNIVKAVEEMLNHIEVVVEEMPSIVLISKGILPKKMQEIMTIYNQMVEEGYPLDYLNVEFNIEEANKKIQDILDRAKVLDLEDSLFDLKVLNDYFESLFTDFEKEKIIKQEYEAANKTLKTKLDKMNNLINCIINSFRTGGFFK